MKVIPNYNIHPSALAIKALLENMHISSKTVDGNVYVPELHSAPWYNGRERGIVFFMREHDGSSQINVAVFENRRSDDIDVIVWSGVTFNPPTIHDYIVATGDTPQKPDASYMYTDHYDAMGFIYEQLRDFWMGLTE